MDRLLDYARLVRLPNVFTAIADICLGALATGALPERLLTFIFLVLASTALYWAGMIWNDFFDVERDRRERPFRPLASGRISLQAAWRLGSAFLLLGVCFAALADWAGGTEGTAFPLAIGLVCAILLYDAWLKRTWLGPFVMGSCRLFNVLLGLCVAGQAGSGWGIMLAMVVAIYVVGVTWFARTEVKVSNPQMLTIGGAFMLSGLLLALTIPPIAQEAGAMPKTAFIFPYLLALFGVYVGSAVCRAISQPLPARVQKAVKRSILGLVGLDAILASALAGPVALLLVILLVPALLLGRWVYST